VDRKLPHPFQTFASLYGTWVERLRSGPPVRGSASVRRMVGLIVLDAAILSALIIGIALGLGKATTWFEHAVGIEARPALALVLTAGCMLAFPLVVGIGRLARRLGTTIAEVALPRPAKGVDFDAAPRRSLVVALQLAITLGTGIAVLAITQPFLPEYSGPIGLAALAVGFGVALWRSATNLESHVRAGSQAVLAALTKYARTDPSAPNASSISEVQELMPGLGAPMAVQLEPSSPSVGKSLAELHLRGLTGATVLAISRGEQSVVAPEAGERLAAGDVLALAGTRDSIDAARALLLGDGATTLDQSAPPIAS
jgi:CPA2 family monovalent cation:H+ antiporter-2